MMNPDIYPWKPSTKQHHTQWLTRKIHSNVSVCVCVLFWSLNNNNDNDVDDDDDNLKITQPTNQGCVYDINQITIVIRDTTTTTTTINMIEINFSTNQTKHPLWYSIRLISIWYPYGIHIHEIMVIFQSIPIILKHLGMIRLFLFNPIYCKFFANDQISFTINLQKRKIIINVKQDNRLYDNVASEQKRGYILSFLSSFLDYSISSCDDCDERKNRKKRKQRTKFSDTIYCSFILWMIGNIIISFFLVWFVRHFRCL